MLNTSEQLNILVTGGCGFIGSDFLRQFVRKYPQHKWINLDALTYAGKLTNVESISQCTNYVFIHGDICNQKLVDALFIKYKIDIVINFAAESHVDNSISNPNIFLQTNIIGTQILLETCKKYGIKRFHQVSTDEVYGDLSIDKPEILFTEITPLNPSSPYSASKASADMICMAYNRTFNVPITISRCSNNYGEYQDDEKFIPTIIRNISNNKQVPIYGTGQNVRDWIYVGEHNIGVETIVNKGENGQVYNLGSNNEYSNIDLVKLILKIMNKDHSFISYVTDRMGHDERYAIDWEYTYKNLGWKSSYDSTNFEKKLTDVVKWYISQYNKD